MNVRFDTQDVVRLLGMVKGIENGREKALFRTVKEVNQKGKLLASREVRKELALKAAYVKSKIKTNKPSYSNLTARIYARKRGIQLSRFMTGQIKKKAKNGGMKRAGVKVRVTPGSRISKMRGYFALPLKNGNFGIAKRVGTGRNDYEIQYGPSVSQVMDTYLPEIQAELRPVAREKLAKEIESILKRGR